MNFISMFKNFFGNEPPKGLIDNYSDFDEMETAYIEFAFQCAKELLADVLCSAKFDFFVNGKIEKKKMYYRFNLRPNVKQTKNQFMRQLAGDLMNDGKALIVQIDDSYYLASSWATEVRDVSESIISDIYIGNYKLADRVTESQVILMKYDNDAIEKLRTRVYRSYGKLLGLAIKSYKRKNGQKATMQVEGFTSMSEEIEDAYTKSYRSFAEAENGLYLHDKTTTVNELGKNTKESTSNVDVMSYITGAFSLVSSATKIPIDLLLPKNKSDKESSEAMIDELVQAFIPIKDEIEQSINGINGMQAFCNGTRLIIDINAIKRTDPLKAVDKLEKALRIGLFSPNDEKRLFDIEEVDEEWAYQYYITKNYQAMVLKGGENNAE